MSVRKEQTTKQLVVRKATETQKYWMAPGEYTGIIVDKDSTDSEYVVSDGRIAPGGSIPDHYHKWEDQTFHVLAGAVEAKIGDQIYELGPGDSVHCPRGISHHMKNIGTGEARLISYIFPGDWAEEFMAETARQSEAGRVDRQLIEERFGVVYL